MPVPSYAYTLTTGGTALPVTSEDLGKALPVGRDLELDPDTHDLVLASGDLDLVADGAAIRQEIDNRLRFFLGEWFLDITQGVPYLQTILVKNPDLSAIRTVLRDEILKSAGITSLKSLDLEYDSTLRTLLVTWEALTDVGELIESEVVF